MSQDTNVSNLIINKLTKQQFDNTTPDPTQLYFVTDDNGISSLDDISISSLSNGQILKYNSTSGKWENADIPEGLPSQTSQSGKFLTTNGTTASWATIPAAVTEATVSGWGFTKNVGTVTKVNNTSPDSSGNVTLSIPAAQVNSDWNATSGVAQILNKPAIPTVVDTYSSTGTDAISGKGVKAALDTLSIPSKISDLTDDTATYPVDKADTLTGLTATVSELNYVDGVTSAIQTQLNGKQDTLVSGTNIKTVNSTSLLGNGDISITGLPSQTSQSGKFLTTNGTTASWANVPTEIPTQTGNSGKFLTTNGSAVSWAAVDALPSQSGQSGKYLTTNGTTASWGSAPAPAWGSITGTLASQTDLKSALDDKVEYAMVITDYTV